MKPRTRVLSSLLLPVCIISGLWFSGSISAQNRKDQLISEEAARQIQAVAEEKRARTPAQKKIDSQLLYALKQKRGETRGVPTEPIDIKLDPEGRTLVDITCIVSKRLLTRIERLGGDVLTSSEKYHTLRAWFPLNMLENLASRKDVRYIMPPSEAMTNKGAKKN